MPHHFILFGADLSLDPRRHGDLEVEAGMITATSSIRSAENTGEGNHADGLVDYLGALPVLELSIQTSPHPASHDSVSISDVSTQLTLFNDGTGKACHNTCTDQNKIAKPFAEIVNAFCTNTSPIKLPLESLHPHSQDSLNQRQPEMEVDLVIRPHMRMDGRIEELHEGHNAPHAEFTTFSVPCQAIVPRALPLARKASLTRFLEMRKKRLVSPYVSKGSAQVQTSFQGTNFLLGSNSRMCNDESCGNAST